MARRITVAMDDDLYKKLVTMQKIKNAEKHVSFSRIVSDVLRKSFLLEGS